MIEYPQLKSIPESYLREKLGAFLSEDIPFADITSMFTVPEGNLSSASLNSRGDIVFAGGDIIRCLFEDKAEVRILKKDGEKAAKGDTLALIKGDSRLILGKERVMLNLVQRMSAIATTVNEYVEIARPHGVKILDTRKTTPGLRLFEKYAVNAGGGHNHRMDLSAGILIKDNHIRAAGGVTQALNRMRNANTGLPVQMEADTAEQVQEAMKAGVDGFLLDNMSPATTRSVVEKIRSFPGGERIFIESSGGINLASLAEYVTTGINAVSVGALTHNPLSIDLGLDFS